MSEDVFIDMLEDDASAVSDTPRTDPYIGTHETHRINGRNIYDHARELERELNKAKAYAVELTAKYLEASGKIQVERDSLRADYNEARIERDEAVREVMDLVREAKAYIDTMGDYTRTSESLRNVLAKHKEA
jgi:putative heme iron utilization protein